MADKRNLSPTAVTDYLKTISGTQAGYKSITGFGEGDRAYSPIKDQDASDQDFLSWLIDIASRPLFAVTETASSVIDAADPQSSMNLLERAGHVASAPLRGLFSTNAADKIYTGELIEKGTDVVGKNTNPNYKDVQDNVNPVTKGVLGFAGDVGLDFTTYLGLGLYTKLGKKIAESTVGKATSKATKSFVESSPLITNAAKATNRAATKISKRMRKADDVSDPTDLAETVQAANDEVLVNDIIDEAANNGAPVVAPEPTPAPKRLTVRQQKLADERAAQAIKVEKFSEKFADAPLRTVINAVRTTGGKKALSDQIKELKVPKTYNEQGYIIDEAPRSFEDFSKTILDWAKQQDGPVETIFRMEVPKRRGTGDTVVGAPIDVKDLALRAEKALEKKPGKGITEAQKVALREMEDMRDELAQQLDEMNYTPGIEDGDPKVLALESALARANEAIAQKTSSLDNVSATNSAAYKDVILDLEDLYKKYTDAFNSKVMGDDKVVTILGDIISVNKEARATTALGNLQLSYAFARATAEALFGKDLANSLRGLAPDAFDDALDNFLGVLDKDGLIDEKIVAGTKTLDAQRARVIKFIERVGVDYESFRRLQDAAGVRAQLSPNTAATTVEEAANDFLEPTEALAVNYGLKNSKIDIKEVVNIVKQAIIEVFGKDLDIKKLGEHYKFLSGKGVLQTSDDFGIGVARDLNRANTFFQYDLYKAINERVFAKLFGEGNLQGLELNVSRYQIGKGAIELAEDFFRHHGFNLHIDNPIGDERFMLSITDIFETLYEKTGSKNYHALTAAFFNASKPGKGVKGTGSAITKFLDATAVALAGGNRTAVRKMLTGTTHRNKATLETAEAAKRRAAIEAADPGYGGGTKVPNFLSEKQATGVYGLRPRGNTTSIEGAFLQDKSGSKAKYIVYKADDLADVLTDAIMSHVDDLQLLAKSNLENTFTTAKADAYAIANRTLTNVVKKFRTEVQVADGILEVANLKNAVIENSVKVGASITAHSVAQVIVDSAIGDIPQKLAKNQVKRRDVAKASIEAKTPAEKAAAKKAQSRLNKESYETGQEFADNNLDEVVELARNGELPPQAADEVFEEVNRSSYQRMVANIGAGIRGTVATMFPSLHKAFVGSHGLINEKIDSWEILRGIDNVAKVLLGERTKTYRKLRETYRQPLDSEGTNALTQAFGLIQKGEGPGANPEIAKAYKDLFQVVNTLFDFSNKSDTAMLNTPLMRNSPAGIEMVNKTLKDFKILTPNTGLVSKEAKKFIDEGRDFFDVQKAIDEQRKLAKRKINKDLLTIAVEQWREWPVDDVTDFLSKIDAAILRLATDVGVIGSFQKIVDDAALTSKVAVDGFVKLELEKLGRYDQLIDNTLYYDKEVADVLYRMDELGLFSNKITGDMEKVMEVYDQTLQFWKYSITQLRPGHHPRNAIGSFSAQGIAEGPRYMAKATNDAAKALHLFGNITDVDMVRYLNRAGQPVLPRAGDVFSKGVYGDITRETSVDAYHQLGMRRIGKVAEGIWEDEEGALGKYGKFIEKVSLRETIVGDTATKVSEWVDNITRLSHFYQIIHKEQAAKLPRFYRVVKGKKVADLEALYKYAAKRVQKFHPDSSTLSNFERKYMARIFPFYQWTRGAVPALLEAAAMNPGRVLAIDKASYNIAIAMGVNPDSLSDPFPEDQMFPSFLTEKVQGPQIKIGEKYYSVSPGFISWDIPNTFATDPFRGALGMSSPIIRMPLELLTGTSVGTGAKIRDFSDYVDSNLPGINYAASISGYSPTGSIASMLQGMGMDPLAQVAAGNRTGTSSAISIWNYLTGTGVSEYTKPNYINYAEIEKRNREAPKDRSGY